MQLIAAQENCALEQQIHNVNQSYLKMDTRVKALESAYKRPASPGVHSGLSRKSMHNAHFYNNNQGGKNMLHQFLRSGQEYGQKSLTTTDARSNTILIPASTQDFVEKVIPDYSPLRKIARVTHITTDSLELLMDKGGGDVGWVAETGARDETVAPELAKLTIATHEMFAKPRASQKLLDDVSVDLEHWLVQKIAWQMGLMETVAFVSGDGKGKPRGFLSYPTTVIGKPEWGKVETLASGSDGTLEDGDLLVDVFHSLKPEYLSGACWVMARSTLAQIRKLKDKDGQYLWMPHVSENSASTLLGYPVIVCDAMPGLSKDGLSIAFGHFGHAYQIVERQDIQLLRDPYSAKPYVEFYATKRVGGDVVNFDALRLIQLSE